MSVVALDDDLVDLLGPDGSLTQAEAVRSYQLTWSNVYTGRMLGVVPPETTALVSALVASTARAGKPLVPQGGTIDLYGGATPHGSGRAVAS